MAFHSNTEQYYTKFIELQEKLRESEEKRYNLELKFGEILQISQEEHHAYYSKLKHKYKRFLEEDQKRQVRNERLLKNLEKIDSRLEMISNKTDRISTLRVYYQNAIQGGPSAAASARLEYPSKANRKNVKETDRKSTRKDIIPSPRNYDNSDFNERKLNQCDMEKPYKASGDLYSDGLCSNQANTMADDILHSLYYRYYNKHGEDNLTRDLKHEKKDPVVENLLVSRNYRESHYAPKVDSAYPKQGETEDLLLQKLPSYKNYQESVRRSNEQLDVVAHLEKPKRRDPIVEDLPLDKSDQEILYEKRDGFANLENIPKVMLEMNNNQGDEELKDEKYKNMKFDEFTVKPEDHNLPKINQITLEPSLLSNKVNTNIKQDLKRKVNLANEKEIVENLNETKIELVETKPEVTHDKEDSEIEENINNISTNISEEKPLNNDMEITEKSHIETAQSDGNGELVQRSETVLPVENKNDQSVEDVENSKSVQDDAHEQAVACIENDDNGEPLQYDENGQLVTYDQHGQPIQYHEQEENYNDTIQYDENGQPIQYDENEQSIPYNQQSFQYDANGQPVQYDEHGQSIQYDENGQAIHYDENGQPIQYDENGQPFPYDSVQYDENGQPINYQGQYNENEQPIQYDANGQPFQYDANGQTIHYDANGQPISYERESVQYDETGQPIQYEGQSIQYDENGQPIHYDENGQPIQYDTSGQPILYEGDPVQYDETGQTIQYDANGQPIQYDANGHPIPYEGDPVQYDENRQPIPYYPQSNKYEETGQYEEQPVQLDENRQTIETDNTSGVVSKNQEALEENKSVSTQENIAEMQNVTENIPGIGMTEEKPKENKVLEMLDTDTESFKDNTKVSNDSDFDFSNN